MLLGSFPISQLAVPYRSLKFLGEHVNLPQLLKLHLPEDYDEWSAVAISDAWAYKRGFLTAKAARPDRYRAANHILRMCLAGQQQLVLQFYPPGYEERRDHWFQHPDLAEVKKYQQVELEEPESETNGDTSSVCSDSEYFSLYRDRLIPLIYVFIKPPTARTMMRTAQTTRQMQTRTSAPLRSICQGPAMCSPSSRTTRMGIVMAHD